MRYKTAEFLRRWNAAAKPSSRIVLTTKQLHQVLADRHEFTDRRYIEMSQFEAKDGTTHIIEF